ncbi:MAG: biotin synthase BioB [Myxococcota bacterium]|nr:biotin synthase BioB [Myxococcota bacterium]
MTLDWHDIVTRGKRGIGLSESEALAVTELRETADLQAMMAAAEAVRFHHKANYVNTCGITNAKSGRCPERCNFCSQSAHFETAAPTFTTKAADTIVREAEAAFAGGVREFSIVMAGRRISSEADLSTLEESFRRIRASTGMQTCASLGLMTKPDLQRLQKAGMQSMHHNLETARSYHDNIVETHTYDEEVETLRHAKSLGMYVCSGGIFGMGETWAHRVEMALDLREIDVDSVPINFLNPRPGTPLADQHDLTPVDCLKIIALYRLILPTKDILVCGGREMNLLNEQSNMFKAGANGLMMGNYLTTEGVDRDHDFDLIESLGMAIRPPPHAPHPPSVPPTVRAEGTDLAGLSEKNLAVPSP